LADKELIHPYIPNSNPTSTATMLEEIGASSIEELFQSIPEHLRYRGSLELPKPYPSEIELRRNIVKTLEKTISFEPHRNFRGGGCWQHYVPAICDEILSRGEFLTAYTGSRHANVGSFQAQFEFQSMISELTDMDIVSYVTYDWGSAARTALGMAQRITQRCKILVPKNIGPWRSSQIETMLFNTDIVWIDIDPTSSQIDMNNLRDAMGPDVAAIYIENPCYLGNLETQAEAIGALAHEQGAIFIVGVDPLSLGVVEAPGTYEADIVCGTVQTLGIHMFAGGGLAGLLAMRDEERIKTECPWPILGLLETQQKNEFIFGWANFNRTPYELRDESQDFIGTGQTIWAIIAGVYLALMGPKGMQEIGETILQRSHYAAKKIAAIPGITLPMENAAFFKEFVVNIDNTGKKISTVNAELNDLGFSSGIDLSESYPRFGQAMLVAVTECHNKEDIDAFALTLEKVVS